MIAPEVASVAALRDEADLFLVDQFGTLHDGERPYPGAVEALRHLRETGARVVLLSNSGRRGAFAEARLNRMGIGPECYDLSICSGEVAWQSLTRDPPAVLRRHCRVLLLARDNSLDILEGLDVERVADPDAADLVMIAGSETDRKPLAEIEALLTRAVRRDLPAICTNPDRTMIAGGRLCPGAGALADLYLAEGGAVRWFGKPHAEIYEAVFARFPEIPRDRAIAVGDSIEHDIAGAKREGARAVLVRTGILADQDEAALRAEAARHAAMPDFLLPRFA